MCFYWNGRQAGALYNQSCKAYFMAQCQLFAILFIFNNKSINNLVSNIKVIEKVVFTDVFYKDMIFTKENVKHPLFFKNFKIENENLKLQKEMEMF